jgi:hypothetical protein
MDTPSFTDQLRRYIETSGESRYALAKRSNVDAAVLCRFVAGRAGMSLDSVDKLVFAMGLELRPCRRKGR